MAYTPDYIEATETLPEARATINGNFDAIQTALLSAIGGFDYIKTGLTGGAGTDLDGIDGAGLTGAETAIVFTGDSIVEVYIYRLDADSGLAASSPEIIAPAVNPGSKRWILAGRIQRVHESASSDPTASDDESDGYKVGDLWIREDTDQAWLLVDATTDLAEWIPILELGIVAGSAAEGNDSRFPSSDEKAALAGTSGTPSGTNKYVTNDDSRNSDSRTPTAHASSHMDGADAISTLPSSDQKAALAGTSGTPSGTNKYVTNDDSRNSDSRTPTAHASSHMGGADAISTLPSSDQKAALAGTSGTPSGTNKYVTNDDSRLGSSSVSKAFTTLLGAC